MEEGFNYPAGTALAANPPWSGGIGSSVEVVGGNLTLTNLQDTAPSGNMLQIGGGASRTVYRNFSGNAVTGGAVYYSALIRCLQLPTNSQFIASLLPAGSTSHNRDTDPLTLSVTTGGGGYRFSLSSAGGDSSTGGAGLTANSTHFIVLKYIFGSTGQARMYVDPTPGGVEPSSATISPEQGDSGTGAANLQVLLLQASSSVGQGVFNFDTIRVGTNWADVTPMNSAPSITGPQHQAVCSGSPAEFSVTVAGPPPFSYQWRTNGIAVPGATNGFYLLPSPTAADALNSYDVVVADAFGSVTSRVASLAISYGAPFLSIPPASQMIVPGVSNATFSVTVLKDALLSFQWHANGIAIPGATNTSYTTTNVGPADVTNLIDVVVSDPCGSITSAPPVGVYFPTLFYAAADAGAGFFSGENIIFTNISGLAFYAWSSPDPTISVTVWTLEGPMTELPLGTSGFSRYGINVNPVTSPVYYIIAQRNTGPYPPTEWVIWLTTPDFASYSVNSANVGITAGGILEFPTPPGIAQQPQDLTVLAGQNASFSVQATGSGLGYLWLSNNLVIPAASVPILGLTNVSAAAAGPYAVIVTNSFGSITSSVATLTVALPPAFSVSSVATGTIQLNANSITGLTYVVQSATNLINPIWVPVLTNNTGNGGLVNFQIGTEGATLQFYRLVFP